MSEPWRVRLAACAEADLLDIAPGIRTLHVARQGRKGRHLVMFRVAPERVIEVLRLLHDSMDLSRHWPNDDAAIQ